MFEQSLIATKAYPLHLGHDHLIRTALAQSEHVAILVVSKWDERPNGARRTEWVRAAYPSAEVVNVVDIGTDDADPASSLLWAEYARDILDDRQVDAVFASEPYGARWAAAIAAKQGAPCRHVAVDPLRTLWPVSGRKIRKAPYVYWQYLHPQARRDYLKRILVVGAESTGKTTLCQKLANHFQTFYVPEYGRYYVERKGGPEKTDHRVIFGEIANRTPVIGAEIEGRANRVVFWDTDLFTTALWYEVWQPDRIGDDLHRTILERAKAADDFDVVFISDDRGTDWVDDGQRDQKETRSWFTRRLREHFADRAILLDGTWDARFERAVEVVDRLLESA